MRERDRGGWGEIQTPLTDHNHDVMWVILRRFIYKVRDREGVLGGSSLGRLVTRCEGLMIEKER